MKKSTLVFLILAVFASAPLWGNEPGNWNWDILNKSMSAWDTNEGESTNGAWTTAKGGTITVQTVEDSYVNLVKSGNWAWFRPTVALGNLTSNTAYTVEVKVRVKSGNQGQISLRMNGGGDSFTAPIFLKYGDEETPGSVSTVAGGASNAYTLNTSDWQIYRLVLRANHSEYDVYVDGLRDPVLQTGKTASKTDQGGVYFGAESSQSCELDIEYVRMGTGDIMANYNATLSSLSVNAGTLIPAFNPGITEYVCELFTTDPGTVTPSATAASDLAQVTGLEPVVLSETGKGLSTITVTAGDGETVKVYTIRYLKLGEDRTSLIVNNDFDYAADGVAWNASADPNYPTFPDGSTTFLNNCFRPIKQNVSTVDTHAEFYGWQMSDWSFMFTKVDGTSPTQSIGIGSGNETFHSGTATWIAGNNTMVFPNDFEFYQVIDKDVISAGTYKVTCLLGIASGHLTSQRLFANQKVQFFGKESDYETNKTEGEIYSYAGYTPSGENDGKGLKVYVTISEGDSLKLGLRGGSYKGDGTLASTNNLPGWFKFDYFTLIKVDPAVAADATLSDLTLSVGAITFSPTTYVYNVQLPRETTVVIPAAVVNVPDATVTGVEEVDLSSGSGTSTITVTALDGTTQTYTINYTTTQTRLNNPDAKAISYDVTNGQLSVRGVEAYTVYNINGIKAAEVINNTSALSVSLAPGVYVVKTPNAGAFKVVVK
jgi:hypothetical protein